MLLVITERNAWEQEAWSYVLDITKQEAAAVDYLMKFVKLANEEHSKASKDAYAEQAKQMRSMGGLALFMRGPAVFASSGYSINFYDKYEQRVSGNICVMRTGSSMHIGASSYKNAGLMLDAKISVAKMKSALTTIREKKENKLYKNFESVFLKEKVKHKKEKICTEN